MARGRMPWKRIRHSRAGGVVRRGEGVRLPVGVRELERDGTRDAIGDLVDGVRLGGVVESREVHVVHVDGDLLRHVDVRGENHRYRRPYRPVAPNLLDRRFEADAPNARWVGDTTELQWSRTPRRCTADPVGRSAARSGAAPGCQAARIRADRVGTRPATAWAMRSQTLRVLVLLSTATAGCAGLVDPSSDKRDAQAVGALPLAALVEPTDAPFVAVLGGLGHDPAPCSEQGRRSPA
jgi:hypothetical protein